MFRTAVPSIFTTTRSRLLSYCNTQTQIKSRTYHQILNMKVAIEGCCHGELDNIYKRIQQLERENSYKVDFLLICGDFQAMRNHQDLQCMAAPNKYKLLQHFYKYYTGEKKAPLLTVVIGGNHEASSYMWELYHGGWLAPNIYFLGHAGCIRINGIRIAGSSGIFKSQDFHLGHYEKLPYDARSMRSIYHIREYCVRKLSLLSSINIFLSHDWPQSIEQYGDLPDLLNRKSFLRQDIDSGTLGSPPLMGLLRSLKPQWWFAAHMHTRYEARVVHESRSKPQRISNPDEILIQDDEFEGNVQPPTAENSFLNPDEITLSDEAAIVETPPPPPNETKFLALDKCLPRRQFLEVVDLPLDSAYSLLSQNSQSDSAQPVLSFDPEWLAISRAFHPWLSTTHHQPSFPEEADARAMVSKELKWVIENVEQDERGDILVSDYQTFTITAPGPGSEGDSKYKQPPWYTNPQTEAFCRMLDLENKINPRQAAAYNWNLSGSVD